MQEADASSLLQQKTLIMMDMDMVIVMVMMATMGEGGWCAEKRFDANSA